MLELTTKASLAQAARTLAESYELVQLGTVTYIPMNWRTEMQGPCAAQDCIWMPLKRDDKRRMANKLSNVLFANDSELTNFDGMLRQFAREVTMYPTSLLIKTEHGLRLLDETGQLVRPGGSFQPNFIRPQLNEDPDTKKEIFDLIAGWLNSEEEAVSLLHHLATALSPGWSAVKYILFIGSGRNGKSLLLSMLSDLFGAHNISGVSRQQMAERLPVCVELNNKLLNIIYDGSMNYIKDSSMEKTLIAGEQGHVRMLYENGNTMVQTNALFLEALNSEPKSRDKSGALQKRLSRFVFSNTYPLDRMFEKRMRTEPMLGAFLSLLLDHFVQEDEIAEKLQQTEASTILQVEQQLLNTPLLQYIEHLINENSQYIEKFETGGLAVDPLAASFMAWRLQEGYSEFSSADVRRMFKEQFHVNRKSVRDGTKVTKKEILAAPKAEVQALLKMMKGSPDDIGTGDSAVAGAREAEEGSVEDAGDS